MSDLDKTIEIALKAIEKTITESFKKESMKILAKKSAEDIRKRTRKGLGVNKSNSPETLLKPLKERTIEIRKELKKEGKLSSKTRPSKSNITRTGELVDSVDGTSFKDRQLIIYLKDSKKSGENFKKITELKQGGRIFLNLSRRELLQLVNRLKLNLKKNFDRILNRMKSQ